MEAPIPAQVAQLLRGRAIASFEDFRQAIWQAAASIPELAREFSPPNRALMSRGLAPKAPPDLQVPGSANFHVVHVRHPDAGGAVYDVDNIRVVSPLRRWQILTRDGAPFGRADFDSQAVRPRLIEVVRRLQSADRLSGAEENRLIDELEKNVFYPYAADLIFHWSGEFRTPEEIVDFALGLEQARTLSRDELVALAARLMAAEIENTVQSERLSTLFNANISHPEGDGLIFHPKVAFNSAEELVAHALASGSS